MNKEDFTKHVIEVLSEIPLSGNRKKMRMLSSMYDDYILGNLIEKGYPDGGIKLFEIILTTKMLFSIKGVQNLLSTILYDLSLSFEELTEDQKIRLLNLFVSYYKDNKSNGIELNLCDFLARKYSVDEVLRVFESMLSNPYKKDYLPFISIGLDILGKKSTNNLYSISKLDQFLKRFF